MKVSQKCVPKVAVSECGSKESAILFHRAYKFRVYPTKEQEVLLTKTFGCVRFVYNYYLDKRIKLYKNEKKSTSYVSCCKDLTLLKKEKEWLKEIDSVALQQSLRHLDSAYKNFFKVKNAGFPRFKSRKSSDISYTTLGFSMTLGSIKLYKVGNMKIKQDRRIPDGYKIGSVTVIRVPSGKYYVSILCKYEKQILQKTCDTFIGLDYSMKELYVDNEGDTAEYPHYYRKAQARLKREQRSCL